MDTQKSRRADFRRHANPELTATFRKRFAPHGKARPEEAIALCDGMIDILGACFAMPTAEIRSTERATASIARVRQIGMYVCHVALGLTMKEVAAGYSRDRSTVVHACHLVEDLRDEQDFDHVVSAIERIAQAAFATGSER